MHITVLFGSPRKKGNTMQLLAPMLDIWRKKGYEVKILYLNDLNIRPCQACYQCIEKEECRIADDMKDVKKFIVDAELVVYATPIYWFSPSSQIKVVIDRSISFLDSKYKSRIKGKKAITVMSCAGKEDSIFAPSLEIFKKTFDLLGLSYIGGIQATSCEEGVPKRFLKKALELAKSI